MKHICTLAVAGLTLFASTGQDYVVSVKVNGKLLETKGLFTNGVTYAPVRSLADSLGGTVRVENSVVVIEVPSGPAPMHPLGEDPKAWNKSAAEDWHKRASAWFAEVEAVWSHIDFRKIHYDSLDTDDSRLAMHQVHLMQRRFFKSHLNDFLARSYWLELRGLLDTYEGLIHAIEEMDEMLEDQSDGIIRSGGPSGEDIQSLNRLEVSGGKLALELNDHRGAVVDWYSQYPDPTAGGNWGSVIAEQQH